MKKEFLKRIKKEGIVDTKKYRYTIITYDGKIRRINIKYLGTTEALKEENWEEVK